MTKLTDQEKRQQEIEQRKQELQEQKEQKEEELRLRHEKFAPFVKFCRKQDLKEKEALWADQRIKFFRMDEFAQFVVSHLKHIKTLFTDFEFTSDGDSNDIYRFLKYLQQEKLLLRYERCEESSSKKFKYPKRLLLNPIPLPGPNLGTLDKCFYRFDFQEEQKHLKMYSALLVLGIALICLFPVWPIIVKKIIFYISFYLLIAIMGFTSLRLVLFVTLRIFGLEFWILPNFFDDSLPFVDTFKPIVSCSMAKDDWKAWIIRILGFALLGFVYYHLWMSREVIVEQTKDIVNDVEQWGLDKFLKKDLPSRALPGYETFLDGEDEKEQ